MISLPRFDISQWFRGVWHSWVLTEIWVGPMRIIGHDCIDGDKMESSKVLDIHSHNHLDDWFTMGFLCNCGSCTRCDPPDLRVSLLDHTDYT